MLHPMTRIPIFTDRQVAQLLSDGSNVDSIISEVEEFMRDSRTGRVIAPERIACGSSGGSLVVTAGGSERKRVIGLRVYSTFDPADSAQLTAVYGMDGGTKGIFIGRNVGAIRTAAINAVAVKHLSRHDARTLGIIGTGRQARSVLPAICHVRDFSRVAVSSLHPSNAASFVSDMGRQLSSLGIEMKVAGSNEELVRQSDVIIAVTTSGKPVVEGKWLEEGQHLTSMGGKLKEDSEIGTDVFEKSSIIVTDSIRQLKSYGEEFIGYTYMDRIRQLGDYVDGEGRKDRDISLFLSVGLAGTEVVVGQRLLEIADRKGLEPAAAIAAD